MKFMRVRSARTHTRTPGPGSHNAVRGEERSAAYGYSKASDMDLSACICTYRRAKR
jgi:hypothetical protein